MDSSIYIHIPFCNTICPFCDFTKLKTNKDLFDTYIDACCTDIEQYKKSPKIKVPSIFFGGGTPSVLPVKYISKLLDSCNNTFEISKSAEISFEMNPEDVTTEYLSGLQKLNINRISLGVQSFNDTECSQLGRTHSAKQTLNAITDIKNKDFILNIDLIFSIPNSSTKTLAHSLTTATKFSPEHLSCYNLTIEPNTPFYKQKIKTNETSNHKQYEYIISYLKEKNYTHYEISSFAKDSFMCTHNKRYWQFKNFIGVGVGSHSLQFPKKFKKTTSLKTYINNPLKHILTCTSQHDLILENIIANLRAIDGIKFEEYKNLYNIHFQSHFNSAITHLLKNKLIKIDHSHLTLTKKGLYLLDDVCLSFL